MRSHHPARACALVGALAAVLVAAASCERAPEPAAPVALKLLSAGAVEPALPEIIQAYEAGSGNTVDVTFGTGPQLTERVEGGETADVFIAPQAVAQRLIEAGRLGQPTPVEIARVGVGVIVRQGAPHPDVSSVEALKAAMLAATTVVYNQGSTGLHIAKVVEQLGIGPALADKTDRPVNGEAAIRRIAEGQPGDLGFGALSEIALLRGQGVGVDELGPLPAEVQTETVYVVMPFPGGRPEAQGLVDAITGPQGQAVFAAKGLR